MSQNHSGLPSGLLSGRIAVVAGGTGNVGRQLVHAFLGAGATAVVPSRSAKKLDTLRRSVSGNAGERLITIVGDLGDEEGAPRAKATVMKHADSVDIVVASLGGFAAAPAVLQAPVKDLRYALDGYLVAHFLVARTFMPVLAPNGSYTFVNGPLAFEPLFPGSGLISIATAAQAMLARVVMKEAGNEGSRVNELVLYTSFGWGDDEKRGRSPVSQENVGRYAVALASELGRDIRGQTIHLKSLDALNRLLDPGETVSPSARVSHSHSTSASGSG